MSSLLDSHRQVHARMDCAVQVEGARGIEWPNRRAVVASKVLVNHWGTVLYFGLSSPIDPYPVLDDMRCRCIINQGQHTPFGDIDCVLYEGGSAHVHGWTRCGSRILDPTSSQQDGQHAKQCQCYEYLFIHESSFPVLCIFSKP